MNLMRILCAAILLVLLLSYDSPSQWVLEYSPYESRFFIAYISVIDTNTVWALGEYDSSVVIYSKRGTYWDWATPWIPYEHQLYLTIAGIDSNTCFIGDRYGKIYRITDAGWSGQQILDAGTNRLVVGIKFSKLHRNTGYIFCSPRLTYDYHIIYKTTNYGRTWQTYSVNFGLYISGNPPRVWVTDSSHAFCGLGCLYLNNCAGPEIGYTVNGGINWLTMGIYEPGRAGVGTLAFKSDNMTGIAVAFGSPTPDLSLWKTTNGGVNWTFLGRNLEIVINPVMINIPGTSVWYYGGTTWSSPSRALIYKSSNDGLTWSLMAMDDTTYQGLWDIDGIVFGGKIHAWAVVYDNSTNHNHSKILRLIDTVSIIGINNERGNLPNQFELEPNYPNPFNATTKIAYSLPEECRVRIIIYDAAGKRIKELVNETKKKGRYEAVFNGFNLASGVYYYRLDAGTYVQARRMVLIR